MAMPDPPTKSTFTDRTRLRRLPDRGDPDPELALKLIDEIGIGSIAYAIGDPKRPRLIPTLLWRQGRAVYWHGSAASHALRDLGGGVECCLNAFATDGFVLARSGMHSSVNYRSVTAYGKAEVVTDPNQKLKSLEAFVERFTPGRWSELRPPHDKEIRASSVLRMVIAEASVKSRSGPPEDDEADYDRPVWAGVVPVATQTGAPICDPRLDPAIAAPQYLNHIRFG